MMRSSIHPRRSAMGIASYSFRRLRVVSGERPYRHAFPDVMFKISATPIDPASLQQALADARAGACVTFEGWVRNRNEGQPVLSLEYEAYAPLAVSEGEKILVEARAKFALVAATGVHRVGHLQLGELAVW